jgi:hypothetical protein
VAALSSAPSAVRVQPAALIRAGEALSASGIPAVALGAYQRAAKAAPVSCHIAWPLIAAIGRVESDHGRFGGAVLAADGLSSPPILGPVLDGSGGTARIADTDHGRLDGNRVYDRAVGPMQFIPSTWALFRVDGNGDGRADPFNIVDAARAAAAYLCAAGGNLASPAGQARAVLAYNHSQAYVATVLALAATYAGSPVRVPPVLPQAPPPVQPANPAPPPALAAASHATSRLTTPKPAPSASAASTTPPSSSATPTSTATATPTSTATPTATPTPTTTATPTTTPTPTPTPTPSGSCVPAEPLTVDVVDDTGSPAVAKDVVARLEAGGLRVDTVTTGSDPATSAIEYSAASRTEAQDLAEALDPKAGPPYLQAAPASAPVPHVTVVLGKADYAPLVALVDAFTGLPAPDCTPAPATP